jgi:hypothetical protein
MPKLKGQWIEIDLTTNHVVQVTDVKVDSSSTEPYTAAVLEYKKALGAVDDEFIDKLLYNMEDTGIINDTAAGIRSLINNTLYLFIWK